MSTRTWQAVVGLETWSARLIHWKSRCQRHERHGRFIHKKSRRRGYGKVRVAWRHDMFNRMRSNCQGGHARLWVAWRHGRFG
eukprot:scaffold12252_cov37-Attheya_sp.AAC.3